MPERVFLAYFFRTAEKGLNEMRRTGNNGHQVEIVPPDTAHLIGNYWQIKIDGVLRGNYLFNSARMAATKRKN
jgi:hypothetical protein